MGLNKFVVVGGICLSAFTIMYHNGMDFTKTDTS